MHEQLKEATAAHTAHSTAVAAATSKLSAITEELDELKDAMNDRGSQMSEASPLVSIKQALQQIKSEIKTFDLRIGVVSHSLLATKVNRGKVSTAADETHVSVQLVWC